MIQKINFKIDFFLIGILVFLMQTFICQNAYPNIVSGSGTFLTQKNISSIFDMTYTNPFQFGPPLSCIHTLNGFGFETANLTTQAYINFKTLLNVCSYTMISINALVLDNYLSSIKFYYLAISNQQSMTWVVFTIFPIIDGETVGQIRNSNVNSPRSYYFQYYYSFGGYYMPANSTTIIAYPCISSLQIGATTLINFDIFCNYRYDITNLQTVIQVYNWTYISSITLKVILFNQIHSTTYNDYINYDGQQSYVNQNNINGRIVDFNANVTHFDENYFFTFVGFHRLSLDFTNISVNHITGSTQKHFWMEYSNPTTLNFKTNFMQDSSLFLGSYALFYYLVITKYKPVANYNITSQNINQTNMIILIIVIILSILFIILISIIIYKKCHIHKRLIRKSFTLQSFQNIRFQM